MTLNTTAQAMNGGADSADGRGMDYTVTVGGTWVANESLTLNLTDALTALQTQIGAGYVANIAPNFVMTFGDKVYALAGAGMYFSANGLATTFNDPNAAGNGFNLLSNSFGISEDLQAAGVYQGKLAIAARSSVQIWTLDPDPALNARGQVLPNIGTFAKLSLHGIGDNDLYLLHDSGFRSIRVRDASNNAGVVDVGSPVDSFVQATLQTLTETEKAGACGIVEPSANRYWCYVPGSAGAVNKIYVLSAFPGITAWSTYTPSYTKGEGLSAYTVAPNSYVPTGTTPWPSVLLTNYIKYTGLTVGQTYRWIRGANEVSLGYNQVPFLTDSGTFVATATVVYAAGRYNSLADLTGALLYFSAVNATTAYALTTFVPEKFAVYQGKVYCRAGDDIFLYGGQSGVNYDACIMTGRTPYLDGDAPATPKDFYALDVAIQGSWVFKIGTDYNADTFTAIYTNTLSTFRNPRVPMNRKATHIALDFTESGTGYARFASAMIHFNQNSGR